MALDHESILDLPDEEFRDLVSEALKVNNVDYAGHLTPDDVELLRHPSVVDRTHLTLVAMKKNVEGQLAAKREDYIRQKGNHVNAKELREIEDGYHRWRAGALRFKSGVEEFMLSTRSKRERTDDGYYLAYESLRQAVLNHKATVSALLEQDKDTDEADARLWSLVED